MTNFLGLIFCMFLSTEVLADEFTDQAEYERISIDMEKMGKNGVWVGVDKRYRNLEKLGVDIQFEHYVLGAQAAQELGNILECKKRLSEALEIRPKKKQLKLWYEGIDNNYGYVALFATSKKVASLEQQSMVADPVQQKAIAFAQQSLERNGEFEGMIPIGEYNFSGQKFRLRAGIAVQLDISSRMRRLELNKKQKEKGE